MSEKPRQTTKNDLFKMLADAVRNTPGAVPIEPKVDAQPEPRPNAQKAKRPPNRKGRSAR
jgi:hypothetical protein